MALTKEGIEALMDLIIEESEFSKEESLEIAKMARKRAQHESAVAHMFHAEAPPPNGNDKMAEVWEALAELFEHHDHWKVGGVSE